MTMVDCQSIVGALRHQYPVPSVDPEWVKQCVQALIDDGQQPTLDAVHEQYLWSDLASSSLESNGAIPADPSSSHGTTLFPNSTLLQIESITEIGSSAFQLQNTVNLRRDVLEGRTRIRRIDDPDGEEVDDENMPMYPRGMLRLELSDGRTKMRAMEYKRIDGLRLGETALGCKILLHQVPALRGLLLLEPDNTEVVGGMVEELEATQAEMFISSLQTRLDDAKEGKKPAAAKTTRRRQTAQTTTSTARARPRATTAATTQRAGPVDTQAVAGPSTYNRRQTARIQDTNDASGLTRRSSGKKRAVIEIEDDFDGFEADDSFLRQIDEVEMRATGSQHPPVYEVDSDYGDDIDVDDSFIRQIDEAEVTAQRSQRSQQNKSQTSARSRTGNKRRNVVGSDSASDLMDSGKENKPIVIDSD